METGKSVKCWRFWLSKWKNKMEKHSPKAEIMFLFRYTYRNKWAPDSIFNNKSREWIQMFNQLMKKGFIERKKSYPGYEYHWKSKWPDGY